MNNKKMVAIRRIRYDALDRFNAARAAGAVNGTAAEPGPGVRTVVDTANKLTISGGALVVAAQGFGDPRYRLPAQQRKNGEALFVRVTPENIHESTFVGWDSTFNSYPVENTLYFAEVGANMYPLDLAAVGPQIGAYGAAVPYDAAVILRSAGAFYLVKGGAYSQWTLLWVSIAGATASLYPVCCGGPTNGGSFDNVRPVQLLPPWSSRDGTYISKITGNVVNFTYYFHPAEKTRIEFTVTGIGAGGTYGYTRFGVKDEPNYWYLVVAGDGSLLLYERVNGVNTSRGSATTCVVVGSRVSIDATMTSKKILVNGVAKITYNHASTTMGSGGFIYLNVGHTISDLTVYEHEHVTAGLATDMLPGNRAIGNTFKHTPDFLLEFTVTTLKAGNVRFRKQDANNCWFLEFYENGDLLLREKVAGVDTTRASKGGALATGHRVLVIAQGAAIKVYSNNVLQCQYGLAATGLNEDDGEIFGGDVGYIFSNFVTWPRFPVGAAAFALERV